MTPPIMATDLRPQAPANRRRRHYTISDRGCEVSRKCLECPLSRCKHDDPEWYTIIRRESAALALCQEMERDSLSVHAAAFRFGRSERTIWKLKAIARKLLAVRGTTPEDLAVMATLPPIRWTPSGHRAAPDEFQD